jgi:two-component system, cell cycle sensor histidine kinase and response regulator CckA
LPLTAELPDAVLKLDSDFRIVQLNPACAAALGVAASEAMGQPASELLWCPLRAELEFACRGAESDGVAHELRHPIWTDGEPWHFRVHAQERHYVVIFWKCQEGEGGAQKGAVSLVDADTPLRSALEESEARFRTLADSLDVGILIVREQRIDYANPHCRRMFGYDDQGAMQALAVGDLMIEPDRPILLELIRSCTSGVGSGRRMLQGARSDGEQIEVEVHGTATGIDGAQDFIGIVIDVTERERAAAALREREEQLRHAQKLEAVGRLAGGIAHDFNNLLMVIQGSVSLILMDGDAEYPHRQDLQQIVRATERAAELTRQLLAFGRKQVLRPKVINLNSVVEDLNKMIGRVIGADIELRTELDRSLGNVRVDPGQLEQVILNLIVNARDAMPAGGVLTLRTEHWNLTADDAARAPYRVVPGPYVRLTVSDTGFGMPDSVLSQVFEPFFTTKPRGKGSGLGLSTAYGIVKQSAGYIWIASQPGRGTDIEIYLPRVEEMAESLRPADADTIPRGSGTVLLVEDEEPVRVIARRLLEQGGYTVIEAAGGHEAVQRYDECDGAIDIVLTDVVMPQMGGRELATHLRARNPKLPLLYMSGYADNRSVRRGTEGADDDFLQKPFTPEQLLARIRALSRPD